MIWSRAQQWVVFRNTLSDFPIHIWNGTQQLFISFLSKLAMLKIKINEIFFVMALHYHGVGQSING